MKLTNDAVEFCQSCLVLAQDGIEVNRYYPQCSYGAQ